MTGASRVATGYSGIIGVLLVLALSSPVTAQPTWEEKAPSTSPVASSDRAMAFDAARSGTIFLTFTSSNLQTWQWDGTDWTLLSPSTSPSLRRRFALAYDSARQVIVLFGGDASGDQTWEWNGTDWTQGSPATNPGALKDHAMAYDEQRGEMVLFGGNIGSGPDLDLTWTYDGTTWTQKSPAIAPPARSEHGMAYDAERKKVILFGGETGDRPSSRHTTRAASVSSCSAGPFRTSPFAIPGSGTERPGPTCSPRTVPSAQARMPWSTTRPGAGWCWSASSTTARSSTTAPTGPASCWPFDLRDGGSMPWPTTRCAAGWCSSAGRRTPAPGS